MSTPLTALLLTLLLSPLILSTPSAPPSTPSAFLGRQRTSLSTDWRFNRFPKSPDSISYEALKDWILPAANKFLAQGTHVRPSAAPDAERVSYHQPNFDDHAWESLDLPHDWAIKGPFGATGVGGGMGHLPIDGVGYYRRNVTIDVSLLESGRSVFLDIDGAMAYATVWLNGKFVGGWPYGYASFRVDLTPFAKAGRNLLAIRVENKLESSRWYPGAGIYRNVWLVTVESVRVAQYGTQITSSNVDTRKATLDIAIDVESNDSASRQVDVTTEIFELDPATRRASGNAVATFPVARADIAAQARRKVNGSVTIKNPKLWGPPPTQQPQQYVAITAISINGSIVDRYETPFGIRSIVYDATKGVIINGEAIRIRGTCNHQDLGSLGTAFNTRAAERQIQMLQNMGSNALRTTHNPPAPEFLDIADRLGMLVLDEIFDTWNNAKVKNDFHSIFSDWAEPDLRAFIRRDRNHPSVIAWSVGNEIPEQSSSAGGKTAKTLVDIAHGEDPTRQVTVGMNNANSGTDLAAVVDIIGLNYQGEGRGSSWTSTFPSFRQKFPNKLMWSTESASTVSSRGIYLFPVTSNQSAVVGSGSGGGEDTSAKHVSSYDLYAPSWASSPDKVFSQQDTYPYVAGEFVWTGWDYIGEPTPFDDASRSSYFGIIDLAGFKKDRFYIYQARWRSELPMAHLLPHWTWPDRVGKVTNVHVYTSGDEAELFVNNVTAGRKKKGQHEYRIRWDEVKYAPGTIRVVAYKNGKEWATDSRRTASAAVALNVTADRASIQADGKDLSFITVTVVDKDGQTVPQASNEVTFSVTSGSGRIVSTDNGDPTDRTPFPSLSRKTFGGLALAIVKAESGVKGEIVVEAMAVGLAAGKVILTAG